MAPDFLSLGHIAAIKVRQCKIRIRDRVRRILLHETRILFDGLLLVANQKIIAAPGAVFFPIGHSIDVRQGELVILFCFLPPSQICFHDRQPGERTAEIRVQLYGVLVLFDGFVPLAFLLQVLRRRVAVRRFQRLRGKGFLRGELHRFRCRIAERRTNIRGEPPDGRQHILPVGFR